MDNDSRYFWRRAVEELSAARRSLTPEARERHQHFVTLYLGRLAQLGAPMPFSLPEVQAEFAQRRQSAESTAEAA